jgi:hypothetical protein
MTNFVTRIATGIAILGLAAPAFASTNSKSMNAPAPSTSQTSSVRHHRAHSKVAAGTEKKAVSKKSAKKVEKKGAVKSTKTETPAVPSATPTPASK